MPLRFPIHVEAIAPPIQNILTRPLTIAHIPGKASGFLCLFLLRHILATLLKGRGGQAVGRLHIKGQSLFTHDRGSPIRAKSDTTRPIVASMAVASCFKCSSIAGAYSDLINLIIQIINQFDVIFIIIKIE